MSAKLKRTLNHILKYYGHDILLQRRQGDGYTKRLERHTVRHWYPATRGLPRTLTKMPEGLVNNVDLVYVFRWDANPKELDRIYEQDAGSGSQSVYRIDFAMPMRGFAGELVYWICGSTREEPS